MNPNPAKARTAKAKKQSSDRAAKRNLGDLEALRACLWEAIQRCTVAIREAAEVDSECRGVINSLVNASNSYVRIVEAADLEARISALEGRQP